VLAVVVVVVVVVAPAQLVALQSRLLLAMATCEPPGAALGRGDQVP
jgi:hypothetical protein